MVYKYQDLDNCVVLDTETGGLHSRTHGLCSVTLKVYGKDIIKTFFIKPNTSLLYDEKAFAVNGLSEAILTEKGIDEERAVKEIIYFLKTHFPKRPIMLGQNLHFDINFLNELFHRQGIDFGRFVDFHYLDTMILSGCLMMAGKFPKMSVSLGVVHEHLFNESIKNQHTSEADVLATERVFQKLITLL